VKPVYTSHTSILYSQAQRELLYRNYTVYAGDPWWQLPDCVGSHYTLDVLCWHHSSTYKIV